MIDFNDVPDSVKKLATGCWLRCVEQEELFTMSAPDALACVASFEMTVEEYIAAIEWCADYRDDRH